jgi:hypothetical protein
LKRMLSFDIDSRISIEELYYWMVILLKKKQSLAHILPKILDPSRT